MKTCSTAFLLLASAAAQAQWLEIGGFGSYQRIGRSTFGSLSAFKPVDSDTRLRGDYGYGARITLNTKGYYGFELGYSRNFVNLKSTAHSETAPDVIFYDRVMSQRAAANALVYFMPSHEHWRPFVTGGINGDRWNAPRFPEWPGGGSTNLGINFGGGLKILPARHILFRLDVRDYISGKPYGKALTFEAIHGHYSTLEASAGFSITF